MKKIKRKKKPLVYYDHPKQQITHRRKRETRSTAHLLAMMAAMRDN
jgi:hypothetical protein